VGDGLSAARLQVRGSAPRLKAMAWEQVEELVIDWLVEGGVGAKVDLDELGEELLDLMGMCDCECGSCTKVFLQLRADLREMIEETASELLPEVRLRVANRSACLATEFVVGSAVLRGALRLR
jgi:hypothetical protein